MNPFEKRMPSRLVWAHVDTPAGMPKYFFMVDNTVKVQVQNDVRTARSGCWKIWGILAGGHCSRDSVCHQLVCGDDDIAEVTQELATHRPNLRKRTRLSAEEQATHHLQAIGLKEHIKRPPIPQCRDFLHKPVVKP